MTIFPRSHYRSHVESAREELNGLNGNLIGVNFERIRNGAITNFNRYEQTFNSFQRLIDRVVTWLGFSTERSKITKKFNEIMSKTEENKELPVAQEALNELLRNISTVKQSVYEFSKPAAPISKEEKKEQASISKETRNLNRWKNKRDNIKIQNAARRQVSENSGLNADAVAQSK